MASWVDVFSLTVAALFFFGTVLGIIHVSRAISSRFKSMKTSLEKKGVTISRDGVSLKTLIRFDRETYVDATQRGLVKALNAATVGPETHKRAFLPHPQSSMDATSDGAQVHAGYGKLPFGWTIRKSRGDEAR